MCSDPLAMRISSLQIILLLRPYKTSFFVIYLRHDFCQRNMDAFLYERNAQRCWSCKYVDRIVAAYVMTKKTQSFNINPRIISEINIHNPESNYRRSTDPVNKLYYKRTSFFQTATIMPYNVYWFIISNLNHYGQIRQNLFLGWPPPPFTSWPDPDPGSKWQDLDEWGGGCLPACLARGAKRIKNCSYSVAAVHPIQRWF